jgi:hypothetical protein
MMWVSDSILGQGQGVPLMTSMIRTVSIAHSTATPQVSPSPLAGVSVAEGEQRAFDIRAEIAGDSPTRAGRSEDRDGAGRSGRPDESGGN